MPGNIAAPVNAYQSVTLSSIATSATITYTTPAGSGVKAPAKTVLTNALLQSTTIKPGQRAARRRQTQRAGCADAGRQGILVPTRP